MILGLSSYAYTWSIGVAGYNYFPVMDVFRLVEQTVKLNLNLLQIADNIPLHTLKNGELEKLKKLLNKSNVDLELGAKGLTEAQLHKYINIAGYFNSKILRFVIDDKSNDNYPDPDRVISIIKNSLSALRDANIKLAIENHDRFRAVDFAKIIEAVSSNLVGICLDCANSIGAGEGIYEVVNVLSPYTINLHLKDIAIARKNHMMGFDINGVSFGKGIIPLKWVLEKMPETCKTSILELWMPPEKSWQDTFIQEDEWVKASIEYIKKILK